MTSFNLLLACFLQAATAQSVPAEILLAIHAVEGGRPGLAVSNPNGTRDLGTMQLNTVHLDRLSELYGVPRPQVEARLRDDECFNIQVAAWKLSQRIAARGGDLWAGVGDYHSVTPQHHASYRRRVERALTQLDREGWLDRAGLSAEAVLPANRRRTAPRD